MAIILIGKKIILIKEITNGIFLWNIELRKKKIYIYIYIYIDLMSIP